MLSTPHIETWEQNLFSLISTYGVLISRDSFSVGYEKHLGEFEATLGGEVDGRRRGRSPTAAPAPNPAPGQRRR